MYEVCLFDEARQKPLRGGSTFSLGYVIRFAFGDIVMFNPLTQALRGLEQRRRGREGFSCILQQDAVHPWCQMLERTYAQRYGAF